MDPHWTRALELYRRMDPPARVLEFVKIACSSSSPSDDTNNISIEHQEIILNLILNDPICTKFPPSAKYKTRFLKLLIDLLGSNCEVHEGILDLYFSLSSSKPIEDGDMRNVVYKTWTLRAGDIPETQHLLTIRMADQLDSVGLTSWQAGFMLADFIAANTHIFKGKKCLELGSGIGLTGIVLWKLGNPSKLNLTDYTHSVLQNMRKNLEINQIEESDDFMVTKLDWEAAAEADGDSTEEGSSIPFIPDIILAADCVYDISLIKSMCVVIKNILSKSTESACAYIATTLRNPQTFQFFLDQLELNQLEHQDITSKSEFSNLFDQTRDGIILSKITSKSS